MISKKYIKQYIPPIVYEKITDIKVLLHRKECRPLPIVENNRKVIIIGNGPSLNETIRDYTSILQKTDCFMVNQSAVSDYFELIRPCYYVIVDPFYFVKQEENENIPLLLNAFKNKLEWKLKIFVPYAMKESIIVKELRENNNIDVLFLNSVMLTGKEYIRGEKWYKRWNQNKLFPLSQTVLNTSTSIAIAMGYKEIYLVGADTSWIEMLRVDQHNNDLYWEEAHFYGVKKELVANYNPEKSNVAVELEANKRVLDSYQILREYAAYNACKVYNASAYSYIDNLERRTLE